MKKVLSSALVLIAFCLAVPQTPFACSSFAFMNKGSLVFGTNYDNSFWPGQLFINKRGVRKRGWEPGADGRVASWTSRYGSVTIACVGYQLAWSGMNEAGLVLSTMALGETKPPDPDGRPALASPLWMQYMFDSCATVEDVLKTEDDVRISDAQDHYLICDAKGDCAVIEFLEGKMAVHRGEGLPVRALANWTYSSCLEHYRSRAAAPDNPYHSFNRFVRLAEKMKGFIDREPAGAVDYAFEMLTDVAADGDGTRWSLVFDTGNKLFHLKSFDNRRRRSIDLKTIDFACDTPALFLDAHAGLSGDITRAFRRLSPEAVLAHVAKSLKYFRPDLPEEAWRPLIGMMLESFTCDGPGK